MDIGSGLKTKGMNAEEKKQYRKQFKMMQCSGKSKERQEITSKVATIPFSLSSYVGRVAMENYGRL
jgi:hypothetical protein